MTPQSAQSAKIIGRVRLLLAMTTANGCTEAEAMSAAAKAAELMTEHDLAIVDIGSIKDESVSRQSKPCASNERPREMHPAGLYAAVTVGEFFDCRCWRDQTSIVFFGLRDDVELAHIMLAMIQLAMNRELASFVESARGLDENPRSLSASFGRGMGYRISQRLRELKARRTHDVRATGKDLVVLKGAMVDAAFAKAFGNTRPRKARPLPPHNSTIAYAAGVAAAERVSLMDKEIERRDTQTKPSGEDKALPATTHQGRRSRQSWFGWLMRSIASKAT